MFKFIFSILTLFLLGSACNFNAPNGSFIRVQGADGKLVNYSYQNGGFKHSPTATLPALPTMLINDPGDHFNFTAVVSDFDNDILRVELLANNVVVAQKATAPYSFSSAVITANGNYVLQIRVVDAAGFTGVSEPRDLTVNISNGILEENPKLLIRLGDRHYVGSILEDIFGPSEAYWDFQGQATAIGVVQTPVPNQQVRDILERDVFTQSLLFGGVCEHNQSGRFRVDGRTYVEFRRDNCNDANLENTVRVDRESQILKVCKKLTGIDAAVSHAAGLVGGNINSNPTSSQIQQSFELFYPNLTYDQEIAAALAQIPATRGSAKEKWKILLEGLCQSSYWQVID